MNTVDIFAAEDIDFFCLKRFLNRYGEEAESLIKRNGYPPKYWKSRPHHREMQIKEVWENADDRPEEFTETDEVLSMCHRQQCP